jgi:small subunit ribosomal protein S18
MAKPTARRPNPKDRPNPLDAAGITYVDYKDTALLRTQSSTGYGRSI